MTAQARTEHVGAASRSTPWYPNNLTRLLLQALEETLSPAGLAEALHTAGLEDWLRQRPPATAERQIPFDQIRAMPESLESLYGTSGQGLARRAGRAWFRHILDQFGTETALANLDFRLLPPGRKTRATIEVLADLLNKHAGQQARVEEGPEQLVWHDACCPLCWGRRASEPCDHLVLGVLEESLYWASGGRHFSIHQSRCAAAGDEACSFVIAKKPLD